MTVESSFRGPGTPVVGRRPFTGPAAVGLQGAGTRDILLHTRERMARLILFGLRAIAVTMKLAGSAGEPVSRSLLLALGALSAGLATLASAAHGGLLWQFAFDIACVAGLLAYLNAPPQPSAIGAAPVKKNAQKTLCFTGHENVRRAALFSVRPGLLFPGEPEAAVRDTGRLVSAEEDSEALVLVGRVRRTARA